MACFVLLVSSVAALGDAAEDCDQSGDCKRRLAGCSALIESGTADAEKLADLYVKRGQAQLCVGGADSRRTRDGGLLKGDRDRSALRQGLFLIADPNTPMQAKYDEAISDFDKAVDLDPE